MFKHSAGCVICAVTINARFTFHSSAAPRWADWRIGGNIFGFDKTRDNYSSNGSSLLCIFFFAFRSGQDRLDDERDRPGIQVGQLLLLSQVSAEIHSEEQPQSTLQVRVRLRAEVQVSLLRTEEQANVTDLPSHSKGTPWSDNSSDRSEAIDRIDDGLPETQRRIVNNKKLIK